MKADMLMEISGGYWAEHPKYPVSDWQYEVANGDTRHGYWQWVENQMQWGKEHTNADTDK